ncbi:DUF2891 domain-containing protein [Rouxiella badensis]|jgi:hypothetical protein|uniref:DUF2891 domain-containing protein n=1 Tax=Rouxiella badensis TaxID=1646377 RepID=UPI001B6346C9|nr:DUF2891 domain-containing protein [Rouxiella badensis]MCC3746478.1 DUF2891 domain-containing protein [Rouxiella badensis]
MTSQQPLQLTPEMASRFASLALNHLTREYPNKLTHALVSSDDAQTPRALHPIFYGSYDWHSCVHGYWLLLRLLDRYPDLPEASKIIAVVETHFTAENVAGELRYLQQKHHSGFERPYGWAWFLALAQQTDALSLPQARGWAKTLSPMTEFFVKSFCEFLPKATYPLRVGSHFNTAFALSLTLDYARSAGRKKLAALIEETALRWHLEDVNCQAWEPGGDEFLSPSLMEAELMRRVLAPQAFITWFGRFLPHLVQGQPETLFTPATVTDRTDGKIGHLDGLNLSRAWCQRSLASALLKGDPRIALLNTSADDHLNSALEHLDSDYAGEHWLATFALLALEA